MTAAGTGKILGNRYELVRPLAAGGMGTVWLARHIELETDVAIKLIEGVHALRPDLLERFRREARAAAQLKSPNVVQILDYGVDNGVPYIAMELLDGEDLDGLLERERTLSPERVLQILRPLCRALGRAHAAGIVHRDLKPGNVFLATVTDEEVVKLVDFGIAKEMHRGAEHTTGASMVGSPLFMSPEQIAGSANVDARTDVWSLAVMAYLMLFGEPPFLANGVAAILYRIAHDTFDPPSARSPALAPFDEFFKKALARRPRERYASVGELLAGFESVVGALPDPKLAVDPTTSPMARSGTVAMSPSDAPAPEAFDAPASDTSVGVTTSSPREPSFPDDEAATRAISSHGTPPPSVTIPAVPKVASAKGPPPSRVSVAGILIGVVIGLGALAIYVAQSGEEPAGAALSVASTSPPAPEARAPKPAAKTDDTKAPEVTAPTEAASASPAVAPSVPADAPSGAPSTSPDAPPARTATPASKPASPAQPTPTTKPSSKPAAKPPAKPSNVDPEWGVPVH